MFFFLSDLPSVISAEKLSFIDPHERFFVEEGKKVTGYTWHLKDDYKVYKSLQLQLVIIAQNIVYVYDMVADTQCYRLTYSKIKIFSQFPFRSCVLVSKRHCVAEVALKSDNL